jgi:hypothetical protein
MVNGHPEVSGVNGQWSIVNKLPAWLGLSKTYYPKPYTLARSIGPYTLRLKPYALSQKHFPLHAVIHKQQAGFGRRAF